MGKLFAAGLRCYRSTPQERAHSISAASFSRQRILVSRKPEYEGNKVGIMANFSPPP